jgi:ankyrin repeat protein
VLCCVLGVVWYVCEIEGGASCNACCCRDGSAPIHKAALGGHLSCLELLLTRNADVNALDE